MAPSYPNHLKSIPRSIATLKHYFDVHDQPFARSILYLVILGVLFLLVATTVSVMGFVRDVGRHTEALSQRLAGLRFQDGTLAAEGDQPRILWEDTRSVTLPVGGEGGESEDQELTVRRFVAVLDTTGELESVEDAAGFIGCAQPACYVFFGREQVQTLEVPQGRGEQPKRESFAYTDEGKLKEARGLVEKHGGTVPAFTITDGLAEFELSGGKVHLLRPTAELMLIVDASGETRSMDGALDAAFRQEPATWLRMRPPEFLLFVAADGADLKARFARDARTWTFAEGEAVTPSALAAWAAAEARDARLKATLQQALPTFLRYLVALFVAALVCSVPALIVNWTTRSGLAYGEMLTIAIYAVTPGLVALLFAVLVLRGLGGPWVFGVVLIIGMIYAALGTHRTARRLAEETAPTL